MTLYSFEGHRPTLAEGVYIHPSADVIGNVTLGKNCYVGPGARIRGDYGSIILGDNTAVEDNCVIHARPDEITTIGDHVTLGHGCVIHNCTIKDWAVVGMNAVVSDYTTLGEWAVVGEGAVVGTIGVGGGVAVWQPKRKIRKVVSSRILFIDQSPIHLPRFPSPLAYLRILSFHSVKHGNIHK